MFASSPQPVFRLKKPDGKVETFTPAKIAKSPGGKITNVRIDPSHAWVGELVLSDYSDLNIPGRYEIGGEIQSPAGVVAAAPGRFEILAARFTDLSASLTLGEDGLANKEVVFLQGAPEKPQAVAAVFAEVDPNNAERESFDYLDRGPLPAGTKHVYGVYSNHATLTDALRWTVSSGGGGIHVRTNLAEKTTRATAETPILEVLRPLATGGPVLHLVAILDAAPDAELGLASLGGPDTLPASAVLRPVWRMEGRPAAAAVALSPVSLGSSILLAVSQSSPAGARLRLVVFSPDGRERGQTQRIFPGLAAESAIAVWWSTTGRIHVTFLASNEKDRANVHLVETVLEKDFSTVVAPKIREPLALGEPLGMARIAYFEQELGQVRRAAFLQAKNGRTFLVNARGQTRELENAAPVSVSVALVPGASFWYAFWPTPEGVAARSF
jgi:hypothetical protein